MAALDACDGSVLVSILGVLVVFGVTGQTFKFAIRTNYVGKASSPIGRENVSVFDKPINNSHLPEIAPLVACQSLIFCEASFPHGKRLRLGLNDLNGCPIWLTGQIVHHIDTCPLLGYPCWRSPVILANDANTEACGVGDDVSYDIFPLKWAPTAGHGLQLNGKPGTFCVNKSLGMEQGGCGSFSRNPSENWCFSVKGQCG